MWGGADTTDKLVIAFDGQEAQVSCYEHTQNRTWTVWSHAWRPGVAGRYTISLRVDDPSVPTTRLDSGWYEREVLIEDA